MKTKLLTATWYLIAFFGLMAVGFAADFTIDPVHSNFGFTVRHNVISKVNGEFKDFDGEFSFDPAKPDAAMVKAKAKVSSISTNNEKRDSHLKSEDFFAAEKFPDLTFVSKKLSKKGKGKFSLMGDLTMRGVTKPVTFDVEYNGMAKDMQGMNRAGFTATAKVNRKDFGISFNKVLDNGGVVVGDEVTINLNIEAVQKGATTKQ